VLPVHKCFLSASPVLKSILTALESRLDRVPHISMAEFDKEAVICFVNFLYKGFVVLKKKTLVEEQFYSLCRALRLDPPVATDTSLPGSPLPNPSPVVDLGQAEQLPRAEVVYSGESPEDDVVSTGESPVVDIAPEESTVSTCSSNENSKVKDSRDLDVVKVSENLEIENDLEKDANCNLVQPEQHCKEISEVASDTMLLDEENSVTISIPEEPSEPPDQPPQLPADEGSEEVVSPVKTVTPPNVPEESPQPCDNYESLDTSDPNLVLFESNYQEESLDITHPELALLAMNDQEDTDDETTEHISDYLNLLNSRDNYGQSGSVASQEETETDTFKMPESFDIPQDYIKEIVPYSHSVSDSSMQLSNNPFCTSDDEVPDKPSKIDKNESVKESNSNEDKVKVKLDANTNVENEIARNVFGDDFNVFDVETCKDNTPVQDEVEQITYRKEETSIRYKDPKNKDRKSRVLNPKKDRRKMHSSLFGSDSEEDGKRLSRSKQISSEPKDKPGVSPRSDDNRTPTPTTSLKDELEEKKERMKKKLKKSSGDLENAYFEERKKKKRRRKSFESGRGSSCGPVTPQKKPHTCNSSCPCVKKVMHDVDANFIVSDNHETTSSSDSDLGSNRTSGKVKERKKKSKTKKSSDIPPDESSKNEDSDEESETNEERRKRLDERKARKGGDILAWMSRKGSVRVNVQVQARSVILDMAMYKLQLLADEESQEEMDTTEQNRPQSDTDSDDSIPRGKRIKPLKGSSDESSVEEVKKEPEPKKKSKKKMKKRKKDKKKLERSHSESPAEEVVEVWTPSMYRNWDRKGPKKQSSNSDHKEKAKKHFKRSISMETKNSSQGSGFKSGQNQNKVHRSFSTMDSADANSSARVSPQKSFSAMDGYVGVGPVRGFGPPMATLPKIPKLKKSE